MVVWVKVGALDFIAVIDEKNDKPRSCPGTDLLDFSPLKFRSTQQIGLQVRGAGAVDGAEKRAVDQECVCPMSLSSYCCLHRLRLHDETCIAFRTYLKTHFVISRSCEIQLFPGQ